MGVIGKNMRTHEVDKNMVRNRDGWKEQYK